MLVKELIIFMKQRYNDQNLKDAAAAAQPSCFWYVLILILVL
jgi:hypothetical protein